MPKPAKMLAESWKLDRLIKSMVLKSLQIIYTSNLFATLTYCTTTANPKQITSWHRYILSLRCQPHLFMIYWLAFGYNVHVEKLWIQAGQTISTLSNKHQLTCPHSIHSHWSCALRWSSKWWCWKWSNELSSYFPLKLRVHKHLIDINIDVGFSGYLLALQKRLQRRLPCRLFTE